MKALTIKAPWAQAIVRGTKRIENRTWRPHQDVMGERIAIHQGKSVDEDAIEDAINQDPPWDRYGPQPSGQRPRSEGAAMCELLRMQARSDWFEMHDRPGHIIGTARVVGYLDMEGSRFEFADNIGATCKDWKIYADASTDALLDMDLEAPITSDPWWLGPIGWLLDDVRPVEPVPARGMPGLWRVNQKLVEVA